MTNLLETPQYGRPGHWSDSGERIANALWLAAHNDHAEDLMTTSMVCRHGIPVQLDDVELKMSVRAIYVGFMFLIERGIIETIKGSHSVLIPCNFIEAQQQAYQERITRTNRLANLCLNAHAFYIEHLNTGVVCSCALLAHHQYMRLRNLMNKWYASGQIDPELRGKRLSEGIAAFNPLEHEQTH